MTIRDSRVLYGAFRHCGPVLPPGGEGREGILPLGALDVVKLATRQHANPGMVMSAYERGTFEGNLLDLFEPGFSPAFFPQFVDNAAFPSDWFARTSTCDSVAPQVIKSF